MRKICVIGSLNIDVANVIEGLPKLGETIFSKTFEVSFGGKGANQAVALSKLGADVRMAGKLGSNFYGKEYLEYLRRCNIKCDTVELVEGIFPGIATITVVSNGENMIMVYPGANELVNIDYIDKIWNKISECDIFLLQLEIPLETVLGLSLMEENGLDWDTWDIGKYWHKKLPYGSVCTAETQAYLNFCKVTSHLEWDKPADWKEKIEWVRTYLNPYREWIGAQIRVDAYAYAAAGNPELAAELAWRDASFSHVKNGIYGAMFISAMISAAFVEKDPIMIVEIGLSEIPANCRLSIAIKKAIEIAKKANNQEELVSKIWDEFNHYNSVHTINNAALCAASIIFGDGDFETAVTTAVLGGWDTDCNGATVGSIMGAMVGSSNIPEYWISPLNDTLYSEIPDFHPIKISECAERSYNVFEKLRSELHY